MVRWDTPIPETQQEHLHHKVDFPIHASSSIPCSGFSRNFYHEKMLSSNKGYFCIYWNHHIDFL